MPDNRNHVVLLHMLNWVRGGMERWAFALIEALPQFEWRIWVGQNGTVDSLLAEELNGRAGFYTAAQRAEASQGASLLITPGHPMVSNFPGACILVAHGSTSFSAGMLRPFQGVADQLVAVSAQAALCFDPACRPVVQIIEHAVRIPDARRKAALRRSARTQWRVGDKRFVVAFAGRIAPDKRPLVVAQAAGLINAKLAMAGPASAWKLRTSPRRTLRLGAVADMERFYAGVDCVAMCSRHEGFGLVIAEAIVAGLPLVATPVGVLADRKVRRRCFVVQVSRRAGPRALADAIRRASARHRRPCLASAARYFRRRFSADSFAARWRRLIDDVLDQRSGVPSDRLDAVV